MAKKRSWQNRIIGEGVVSAAELAVNAANFREHPEFQRAVVAENLDTLGWIHRVIVNKRDLPIWGKQRGTQTLIDGHLRVALASERGEEVPVQYVNLTPDEERQALATLDPSAALAVTDAAALRDLAAQVDSESESIRLMLEQMTADNAIMEDVESQLSGDASGSGLSESQQRAQAVKLVLSIEQLDIVEEAIRAVGVRNRGEALTIICADYLERNNGSTEG